MRFFSELFSNGNKFDLEFDILRYKELMKINQSTKKKSNVKNEGPMKNSAEIVFVPLMIAIEYLFRRIRFKSNFINRRLMENYLENFYIKGIILIKQICSLA